MSNDKLAVLPENAVAGIAEVLDTLAASGTIKVSDLFPAINPILFNMKRGGHVGRVFVGQVRSYTENVAMPPIEEGDEESIVDLLELKDVTGQFNNAVFNFYAGNRGLKAKVRNIKGQRFAVIMYKGEVASDKPRHNPWRDYPILSTNSQEEAVAAGIALEAAVKKASKS